MSHYSKGRRAEWRTRDLLKNDGFQCVRAAGSKSSIDLVAWNGACVRFIQVKKGRRGVTAAERRALLELPMPPSCSAEVWRYPNRCTTPTIERIWQRGEGWTVRL